MDGNNNVAVGIEEYAAMIEVIIRQKVLAEFLASHDYVSRDDMFCILGIKTNESSKVDDER